MCRGIAPIMEDQAEINMKLKWKLGCIRATHEGTMHRRGHLRSI